MLNSDGNMYWTVDSLIKVNIKCIKIIRRNVYGRRSNRRYALKSNRSIFVRKIMPVKFYSIFLNEIHPFYDGNGRTWKKLFASDNEIIKLIDERIKKIKRIFVVLNTL